MKKAKIAFYLLFIVFLGVIIYQNGDFFFAGRTLKVDLYLDQFTSPNLPTALWFVSFFLLGWLLAYLASLTDRFRARQECKKLQQKIQLQENDIAAMKKDVADLKSGPQVASTPPADDAQQVLEPVQDQASSTEEPSDKPESDA